jgi:chromate transporter
MVTLFLTFFKLGALIFGSGHALAGAMQIAIVEKQKWMTAEQFQNGWAAGNVLPGPIATKVVAYVGYHQAGVPGAAVATAGYLLPSVGAMVLLAALLANSTFVHAPLVQSVLRGIRPAVLALLADAFLSFTGVQMPRASVLLTHWMPFLVILGGVGAALVGMWWLAATGGPAVGRYLLGDPRAVAIFLLALLGLLVLHLDSVTVTLMGAVLGLSYLVV